MELLKIDRKDDYAIVAMDRGRANPINEAMVNEMRSLFKELQDDNDINGVILTGKEKFFSAGLDVIELYDYDKEQMKHFWVNFSSLFRELPAFSKPLIAAITGHSHAGGCVLALCCDYRIMAEGNYLIGLNEIPVGITLPEIIFNLYAYTVGTKNAHQFLIEGKLLSPEEALSVGLVDEICPYEEVVQKAEDKMRLYLSFDPVNWQKSKQNIRKEFIKSLDIDLETAFSDTTERWFSPETRARMGEVVASLKNK